MDGTRIRRAHSVEQRFVIQAATAADILSWARAKLAPDPHGTGRYDDTYAVVTEYFDSPAFDTFFRRGSFGRAKYRVRRYGAEDVVFVERKLRTAAMLAKRRSRVPLAALEEQLRAGDGDAGWFARRLALRRLSPVCLIGYDRVARQLAIGGQVARLTVDSNVRVARHQDWSFECAPGIPLLAGQSIVELKYHAFPPAIFRALAEQFIMTPQRVSKYRGAVEVLGLAPRANGSLLETQA
jgi:hypothetical protein